jgi:quinol monooxygenase YgiN
MSEHRSEIKGPQLFVALYRPHAGKEEALKKLIAEHVPTLRRLELITDREALLMKAQDGTYVEIAEWRGPDSAEKAHQHPELAKVWEGMGKIADFPALESLKESKVRFPHFQPVGL